MAKVQPATKSTKPTSADKAAKGAKKPGRSVFGLTTSADPNVYPFKGRTIDGVTLSTPEGYNASTMKPLKKKDFDKPSSFVRYQAEMLELKAAGLRTKAEEIAKHGEGKSQGKANRLIKMLQKAEEMRKELESQGIDVAAIMAQTQAKIDASAPANQSAQ